MSGRKQGAMAKIPASKSATDSKADTNSDAKPAVVAKPKAKRRTASAVLKPDTKPDTKLAPSADEMPAGPTPEQVAAWRALSQEERHALREREAARIFSEAAEAHQKGDRASAIEGYNRALFLNPKVPDVYNNLGVACEWQA
jgi:hypothetical protein